MDAVLPKLENFAEKAGPVVESACAKVKEAVAKLADRRPAYLRTAVFGKHGPGLAVVLSWMLGATFGIGLMIFKYSDVLFSFGLYLAMFSSFFMLEYMMTAMFNMDTLSADSFLINHSDAFGIATIASLVEYWLEWLIFPSMKCSTFVLYIGIAITLVGQFFRSGAMFAARHNFTHIIAEEKKEKHKLVKTGLFYGFVRHPSYFGFFWWSVGTQILLCNPVCTAAFAVATWKFFEDRIEYEEARLASEDFFGKEYQEYRAKVPTGIPGIP